MLADLQFVTRAKVTETIQSDMAKIHYKIKGEVFEIVGDTFADAIQVSYSDPVLRLKSAMFKIFEQALI